ncbi:MAG: hypothetical protein ABS70_00685 [Nitrospira sp. SCN 59-13]|nr:MAG: hypothetical protein ABS70_00685 [Nitrospira sp. SCN 59-13]
MWHSIIGTGLLTAVLLTGWIPSEAADVPAPVPNPGPGPTVPPKPSDPIPTPPTVPKLLPSAWSGSVKTPFFLITDPAPRSQEAVSGKLLQLDLAKKEGRLGTDLGREVLFHIPKPELFVHLSVGQRVTIKLDSGQQAVAVLETAAPELPSPSPAQ